MAIITTVTLTLVLGGPLILLLWTVLDLRANVRKARRSSMPYVVRPTSPGNPLWMLFGNRIIAQVRRLPFQFAQDFARFNLHGWEANDRYRIHAELGDIFMLVTPAGNIVYISEAEAIADALRRKDEFTRNYEAMELLNIFGKNISTTDGSEWQKHRKVTAVTFTDRNTQMVWIESLKQTESMLEYWTKRANEPIRTIDNDTKTFTLNVLAAALFAKTYPFIGQDDEEAQASSNAAEALAFRYRDSLSKILTNIIPVMIFGGDALVKWWMPKSMQQTGQAVHSFRDYAEMLITDEKQRLRQDSVKPSTPSLVNLLVKACEEESHQSGNSRNMSLTEQEIISNLFVFAFAGNDTTRIAFGEILVFLAAHPETQDWVHEELKFYLPSDDIDTWDYEIFPKLKRCLAIVMEGLRLTHPFSLLMKKTRHASAVIEVGGKEYTIPPNTAIGLNVSALQTHTRYWGADAMQWNPSRFIIHSNEPSEKATTPSAEDIRPDTTPEYVAWSTGQRACPGKRFSQAELVAALARLLYAHRIEPVPEKGESMDEARNRLHRTAMDIQMTLMMNMKDPSSAGVRWVKR